MKTFRIVFLYLNLLLLSSQAFAASGVPAKPSPPRLVNDFAGLLSQDEVAQLEQKLVTFNDTTSTQITIVIMASLEGYDIDDLAQRIGQEWKVGQKEFDNGIVILIKPKAGNERGLAAISTGYGMEEFIPDAVARRIVDNEMVPFFKQNNYYGGIDAGVNVIMDLASGKFKAADYGKKKSGGLLGLIIPIIAIVIISLLFGKNNNDKHHDIGGKSSLPFWMLLTMLGSSGRGSGGSWGGFSGGGGGGGGFGGFGGGGFGGGGASGSW